MTSRRSFLAALAALVPAWMCGRKAEAGSTTRGLARSAAEAPVASGEWAYVGSFENTSTYCNGKWVETVPMLTRITNTPVYDDNGKFLHYRVTHEYIQKNGSGSNA